MRYKKGLVTSAKQDKTVIVTVHTKKMHPIFRKSYRVSKKFHAHDEANECKIGDEVIISETKPISKLKRWKIDKIVKKAFDELGADVIEEDTKAILERKAEKAKQEEEKAKQEEEAKKLEETEEKVEKEEEKEEVEAEASNEDKESNSEEK